MKRWKYTGIYTLFFLVTFALAYSPLILQGKSFIWSGDGRSQGYPVLIYTGRYIREAVNNWLHGNFALPLFDWNTGAGADIIATFHYYGFGDPFFLLSAFCPLKYAEYLYGFLEIFYIYLAGLAFSALCFFHKKKSGYTLMGAIIYTFSGYVMIYGIKYPFFISPMIQLPLLLIGADEIIVRKKWSFLFSFTVFYAALCGFYFLYMMTIMVGVYSFIRFFSNTRRDAGKEFLQMAVRIAGGVLAGMGMAAAVLFPAIAGFLESPRAGSRMAGSFLHYDFDYYKNWFLQLITPTGSGNWTALSLAAIVVFAWILLFCSRDKNTRVLKLLSAAAVIIYLVPFGGYVMNGFTYPTPRWGFGFILLMSCITVEMLPALLTMDRRRRALCLAAVVLYALPCFQSENRNIFYVAGVAALAVTWLTLAGISHGIHPGHCAGTDRGSRINWGIFVCILLVVCNVGMNTFAKVWSGRNAYELHGVETSLAEGMTERMAKTWLDNCSGRFDSNLFTPNGGTLWGVPTLYSYWSIYNGAVVDFWRVTENIGHDNLLIISGTDQRTITNTLLSVKYYIGRGEESMIRPYGYVRVGEAGDQVSVYENKYSLPWGYTYDSYISGDKLEQMNGLEAEEAMLQSIVVGESIEQVPEGTIESEIEDISYEITEKKGLEWQDGILRVTEENAALTLKFRVPAQAECYLRLEGLHIGGSERNFYVSVQSEDVTKKVSVSSETFQWYTGRGDHLVRLGYHEEGEPENFCTVVFPEAGTFQLKDIELSALPMGGYPERVEKLREESLKNIEFGTNKITGTIDLSENRILCMSIPYSRGWSARVDGKPAEILKGNIMFMALPLEAGSHVIEFQYCSPGLKAGMAVSLISFGLMLMLLAGKCRVRQ